MFAEKREDVVKQRVPMALVALCTLACFPSGFNLVSMGYVAPQLGTLLGLQPGALAPVFVASGLGNVLGSLILGPLADRFGRKAVIVAALAGSVPFVLWTAIAGSVSTLAWSQFAANFLLMGSLPVLLTVAGGEYVAVPVKTRAVAIAWLGFMAGMIIAGIVVAFLPPGHGRSVFAIAAAAVAVIAGAVALQLPDAPPLARASRGGAFSVGQLFVAGRARLTILLWVMFVANLTPVFFLTSWLTTLLHNEGLPETSAVVLAAVLNVGSAIGGLAIVAFVERGKGRRFALLAPAFLLGGIFITAVGLVGPIVPLVALTTFLAGFCANGTQNAATAMVATLYPVAIRSTGASWAIGIGQSGQIAGSLIGGTLLVRHWPVGHMFAVMALGTLVAAACALAVDQPAS